LEHFKVGSWTIGQTMHSGHLVFKAW